MPLQVYSHSCTHGNNDTLDHIGVCCFSCLFSSHNPRHVQMSQNRSTKSLPAWETKDAGSPPIRWRPPKKTEGKREAAASRERTEQTPRLFRKPIVQGWEEKQTRKRRRTEDRRCHGETADRADNLRVASSRLVCRHARLTTDRLLENTAKADTGCVSRVNRLEEEKKS